MVFIRVTVQQWRNSEWRFGALDFWQSTGTSHLRREATVLCRAVCGGDVDGGAIEMGGGQKKPVVLVGEFALESIVSFCFPVLR